MPKRQITLENNLKDSLARTEKSCTRSSEKIRVSPYARLLVCKLAPTDAANSAASIMDGTGSIGRRLKPIRPQVQSSVGPAEGGLWPPAWAVCPSAILPEPHRGAPNSRPGWAAPGCNLRWRKPPGCPRQLASVEWPTHAILAGGCGAQPLSAGLGHSAPK